MPVGIVVVSHSAPLAEDVVALVAALANVSPDDVPLVAAGGLDAGTIGTDAARIAAAIEHADRGDGVLVVTDLGSAVLSALTAVEDLLAPELAARVRISGGPLVEGTFVAAVQASVGDGLEEVRKAADAAADMDKLEGRR
jgi:phosphoenolpyruvate---glycerone phosphotransferase subunit DhaM